MEGPSAVSYLPPAGIQGLAHVRAAAAINASSPRPLPPPLPPTTNQQGTLTFSTAPPPAPSSWRWVRAGAPPCTSSAATAATEACPKPTPLRPCSSAPNGGDVRPGAGLLRGRRRCHAHLPPLRRTCGNIQVPLSLRQAAGQWPGRLLLAAGAVERRLGGGGGRQA